MQTPPSRSSRSCADGEIRAVEGVHVFGVGGGEPPGHRRPARILVRHRGVDTQDVDVRESQVADVSDLARQVPPPPGGPRDMSLVIPGGCPSKRRYSARSNGSSSRSAPSRGSPGSRRDSHRPAAARRTTRGIERAPARFGRGWNSPWWRRDRRSRTRGTAAPARIRGRPASSSVSELLKFALPSGHPTGQTVLVVRKPSSSSSR